MAHARPVLDYIRGILVQRSPTRLVVEAAGLAFALDVPLSTFERTPADGEVTLLCHLVVNQQGPRLYGFATPEERALFLLLVSVSNVGPSMALSMLSSSPVGTITGAIAAEDEAFLKRLKGVGAKTARRIIAELKERAALLAPAVPAPAGDTVLADAVAALVSLGYTQVEARGAAGKARKEHPDADVEVVLREALKRM